MKTMKKIMVMALIVSMLVGLLPMTSMAFSCNNQEYYWNFEDVTDGVGSPLVDYTTTSVIPGTNNSLVVEKAGGSMITTDPVAGGTHGKVYMHTTRGYTSEFARMNYAYSQAKKTVLSFDLYIPAASARFFMQWQIASYQNILFFNGAQTESFGEILKNPDGTNYLIPKDKWVNVSVIADDTQSGQGLFASLFIDGICYVDNKRIADNIVSHVYSHRLYFADDPNTNVNTTYYIDELEGRISTGAALSTVPTVSIDADHQGDNVGIDKKEITLSFAGGSTENLMDTRTYGGITVKAGDSELTKGTDYTLSYADHKNVKITLANDLNYGKSYTVSVPGTVKTLGGTAVVATDLTFTAEPRPVDAENDTPIVTIQNIANNTRFSPNEQIPVTVNVTDTDEIASLAIFVDGSEIETITSGNQFTLSSLSVGKHTIVVKATDTFSTPATGESAPITIIVKENTPSKIGLSVADNHVFYINGNVTIKAQGIDPDGEALSGVGISIDGVYKSDNIFEGPLTVGAHTVKAELTDSRGNKYEKTVTVNFSPQYDIYGGDISNFGINTNDSADTTLKYNPHEYIEFGTENVGGNYGNAMYLVSSDGSPAGEKIQYYTDYLGQRNHKNASIITYDIMAEDVSKQTILFPALSSDEETQWGYVPSLKIINGVVTDTANGRTYGSIENGTWYNITTIYDWLEGKIIISIGGHCIYEKNVDVPDTVKFVRKVKPSIYETVDGGSDGKKFYVDNFRDYPLYYKLNKIKKVESLDSNNNVIAAGKYTSELTAKFRVTLCAPFLTGKFYSSHIELLKNGVAVGATPAIDQNSVYTQNAQAGRAIIITPAEPLEPGAVYTVRLKAGFPATNNIEDLYSSYHAGVIVPHEYSMTVNSERMGFTDYNIVDAQTDAVVDDFAGLAGDVKFTFTCYNSYAEAKPVYAVVGVYNNNELVKIKVLDVSVPSGAVDKIYETQPISIDGGDTVKGFLWMNTTSLIPYGLPVIVD